MKPGSRKPFFSIFLFVSMISVSLYPGELNFSGYYKSFFNLMIPKSISIAGEELDFADLGMYSGKIRLKMFYRVSDLLSFSAEYELTPSILDIEALESFQLLSGVNPPGYRIADLPDKLYPGKKIAEQSFFVNQNLDRFFATINFSFADLYIGRQVISWGSAYVINPTDIISPFNFNEIDKEEKSGVDAVRARIPLGTMDELDIGYVFGDEPGVKNSAFFIRGKFNIVRSDISMMLLGFRQNLMIGFDVSGSLGGAGLRIESAYIFDKILDKNFPDEFKHNYYRISLGLDYNFSDLVYAYCEYHFNSPGSADPERYLLLSSDNSYLEGSVYLLGKHYLSAGITYQIQPLLPMNAFFIYNISDSSLIISPTLEYNISENIYLSAGAFLSLGKGIQGTSLESMNLRSEFGAYPNLIYTSFRIYF